jgi:hypothetical protein
MKTAAISILLLCTTASVFADPTNAFVRPDGAIQTAIDNAAKQLFKVKTEEEATQIVQTLALKVPNETQLVEQVLCYLRYGITTEDQGYGAVILVNKLPVDRQRKAEVAITHLDASDKDTRRIVEEFLDAACTLPGNKRDFSAFETILRQKQPDVQSMLVAYMYRRDPKAAVLTMSHLYGDKTTVADLADQLKGDSKSSLQSLADRPEWWARLYVAETMKKQPQLRDAAILKKLEKDDNPLVTEKVAEITSGK